MSSNVHREWMLYVKGIEQLFARCATGTTTHLSTWDPLFAFAQYYTQWEMEQPYHCHYVLQREEAESQLRCTLLGLSEHKEMLSYCYLKEQTPREMVADQFYMITKHNDRLLDYRGAHRLPFAQYQYVHGQRTLYHIHALQHARQIHRMIPKKYDYYETGRQGHTDTTPYAAFLLIQAILSVQVLKPGGSFIVVDIDSLVKPDILQTVVCIMSCFTHTRFIRHPFHPTHRMCCACVFDGFLGYTHQRVARLWSYYTCQQPSGRLFNENTMTTPDMQTAYVQMVNRLAAVSLPSLRITKAHLEYLLQYRPKIVSPFYPSIRDKQNALAQYWMTQYTGYLPTRTIAQPNTSVYHVYLVDIPGCHVEQQILKRIFPYSDKRSSTVFRQVFRRTNGPTMVIIESRPYTPAYEYSPNCPVWVLVQPPHIRFYQAFYQVVHSPHQNDDRLRVIRNTLMRYTYGNIDTFARLPMGLQQSFIQNKALASQLFYIRNPFKSQTNIELFSSTQELLERLCRLLDIPLTQASFTSTHTYPVSPNENPMNEDVFRCIDRLFDAEFRFFNRGKQHPRSDWVKFSERTQHTEVHIVSLYTGNDWTTFMLNEYLPLLSLLHQYREMNSLNVYIHKMQFDHMYNTYYSELESVLEGVTFHIQSYNTRALTSEYIALPSWATLQGNLAKQIETSLRTAVHYTKQLAVLHTPIDIDSKPLTVRVQPNGRQPNHFIQEQIRALTTSTRSVSPQSIVLPNQSLLHRVAQLTHAQQVLFLPGSDACMALFVSEQANLMDLRYATVHGNKAPVADKSPSYYLQWVTPGTSMDGKNAPT